MKISKYSIILALLLISLISSIILSTKAPSEICNTSNGCEVVYYSQYSSLFGVPNGYYGDVIFAFLSILTISYLFNQTKNKKMLINLGIITGSIVALFFLYTQAFILHAFCRYCLIIDISMVIMLILVLPDLNKRFLNFNNEENIAKRS